MITLYHAQPRLYSLKPLIVLEEKGLAYERCKIGTQPLEQAVPGFPLCTEHRITLEGEGPVLVHDGAMISSSFFMLEYIAEAFDGPALLPAETRGHYQAQAVGQLIAGVIAPFLSAIAMAEYPLDSAAIDSGGTEPVERRDAWTCAASGDKSRNEAYRQNVRAGLGRLAALLGGREYFTGAYSIADIDAYAMMRDMPDLAPGLLETQPALHSFVRRIDERPAVRAALSRSWDADVPYYLPGPEISRWG